MTIKKINKKVIKFKPLSTRDKLVNAAIEHLNTHGREGMTVSKLAEDANVGYGTFYHYFKSPEDIFIAALEGSVSELSIQLRDYFKDEEDKLYVIMKSFQVMFRNLIDNPATPWLLTNPSHLVDVISNANAEHVYRDVGDIIQKNNMVYGDHLRYFDTKYRVMIWAILGGIDEVYRGKDRLEVEITVYKHLEYTLDLYGQKANEIKERLSLDA
jgi:AcrR family transcriptional regulator